MILHVHKDKINQLDLIKVAIEFVDRIDSRKQVFGKFTVHDIIKKARVQHKETLACVPDHLKSGLEHRLGDANILTSLRTTF